MTSKLPLLLAFFISLTAPAQSAPGANNPTVYPVTGIVQNSVTGEPIPHALVELGGGSQKAVFTDSGGRFEFDQLRAGMILLASARKPGFLSPNEVDPTAILPLVHTGPDAAPVILKLGPESVIFGRAQKPDTEPVGYLTVQLFLFEISDGRRKVVPMNSAQTNEEGEFRIAGLKPGIYYLQAGPRVVPTWTGAPGQRAHEAAYRPVFYPGVPDLSSAAPLQVSAGQQLEADLSLNPDPVFRISGTLVGVPPNDAAGNVFPRVTVLTRDNRSAATPIEADPGNEFHTKVPAGSYIVRADIDTPHGPYGGNLPLTVQSDVSGLNLMVAPAPEVRVEVSVQRTHGDANTANRAQAQVNVHFISQDTKGATFESAFNEGSIQGLEPGAYNVEITPLNSNLYVDSTQCGGVDLLRDNLMVGAGTPPIRVSLRDDGGTLAGNVVSDGHAAVGSVLMIPDRAPKQIKIAMTGNNGQFKSPKLAPGDYTVVAFDSVTAIEYANPEAMTPYLANAIHVSIATNVESRVSVNLIQTSK
jgi:hypothetical protein